MQKRRKLILLLSILGIVGIVLGMWLQSAAALPAPAAKSNYRILYLAPEQNGLQASEDVPGSSQALQGEGFQIVSDFTSMKRQTEQQQPDAIVLHKKLLGKVDQKWIAHQYRKGVIVAGINITMRELATYVDDPDILQGNWTEDWHKKPYYSYAGKKPSTDASSVQESSRTGLFAGAITNGTDNFGANIKPFASTIKLSIQSLEQQ